MKYNKLYLVVFFFLFSEISFAQSLPPPDTTDSAETDTTTTDNSETTDTTINPDEFINNPNLPFTGTLDEAYQNEDQLFGSDKENTSETTSETAEVPNYNLKFEFIAHLQFMLPGEAPYIEIQYTNTFETPILLLASKKTAETTINIDTQNWGTLVQNEFLECRLNIPSQQYPVSVSTKLNSKPAEVEGEAPTQEMVLKITFNEPLLEPWMALCSDHSGHNLNSQGAPEEYNMKILHSIEPSLSSMLIPNVIPDQANKVDLSVAEQTIDDIEINNTVLLSGEGSITVSPLE